MGVFFLPFKIIGKQIGKRIGRAVFARVWEKLGDGEAPPPPNAWHRPVRSVFLTAALQAAVLAGVGAVIEQLSGRVLHHLIGAWPGKAPKHDAELDPAPGVA